MNYSAIKYCDIANGTGVRTTLFVSGCRLRCKGCFNEEAWSFSAGSVFDDSVAKKIMESLAPSYIDGLSVLGGEPTEPENAAELASFLEALRACFGQKKDVWLYTGRTWEDLTGSGSHATPEMARVLACLDVLVDGPFVQEEHDISLRFRGSANQRLIDVPASLAAGEVVLWEDDPLFASHDLDQTIRYDER